MSVIPVSVYTVVPFLFTITPYSVVPVLYRESISDVIKLLVTLTLNVLLVILDPEFVLLGKPVTCVSKLVTCPPKPTSPFFLCSHINKS